MIAGEGEDGGSEMPMSVISNMIPGQPAGQSRRPRQRLAQRPDPHTAGATLIKHSVHDVDPLTRMFGPVKSLYCQVRNLNGGQGVEDFAATELEFASAMTGNRYL